MHEMLNNDTEAHLKGYFDNVAMPVDVFHLKSKHKESDVNCNMYCNPYRWRSYGHPKIIGASIFQQQNKPMAGLVDINQSYVRCRLIDIISPWTR